MALGVVIVPVNVTAVVLMLVGNITTPSVSLRIQQPFQPTPAGPIVVTSNVIVGVQVPGEPAVMKPE